MIVKGVVREFGELVSKAERRIIECIQEQRIETEPSITDRFLNELEKAFEESDQRENITFRARTLRDRGQSAPEHRFGADFCGVLDVRFRNFRQSKGFLSQAKMERPYVSIERNYRKATPVRFSSGVEFQRLNEQINRMLPITPDSFVLIYSIDGFVVVPASAIASLTGSGVVYGKPVVSFFKEYLMCFIGDPRLKAYDDETLESLRSETNARTAIMFQIHEAE